LFIVIHPAKVLGGYLRLFGTEIISIGNGPKRHCPRETSEPQNVTDFNFMQPTNALSPMDLTDSGIVIDSKCQQP